MAQADARAEEIIETLKDPSLTHDGFEQGVKDYLLCKYLLELEEYTTDVIFELAELSIENMLAENDQSVKLAQASTTCTNQSSTDIKKVLLSLSLQRALAVSLTPDESAALETVPQLAEALYIRLHTQESWPWPTDKPRPIRTK